MNFLQRPDIAYIVWFCECKWMFFQLFFIKATEKIQFDR